MARDPKGLYKRATAGQIKNFTGIDSPYEQPENPELTLATATITPDEAAERIVGYLRKHGHIPS
jgi:bifunctional enzyme CysN/CysC